MWPMPCLTFISRRLNSGCPGRAASARSLIKKADQSDGRPPNKNLRLPSRIPYSASDVYGSRHPLMHSTRERRTSFGAPRSGIN